MFKSKANSDITKPAKRHKHSEDDECDIIGELIGPYGKWQFCMTILLSLFQIPNTFHIASPVYQVGFFRCYCCMIYKKKVYLKINSCVFIFFYFALLVFLLIFRRKMKTIVRLLVLRKL